MNDSLFGAACLTQALVKAKRGNESIQLIRNVLESTGFVTQILRFGSIDNLYAYAGSSKHAVAFCGHIDVVPEGDEALWRFPPFAGIVSNDVIYGRGSIDMKGGIACFLAALQKAYQTPNFKDFLQHKSILFLITGDEEGSSENGMIPMLKWLYEQSSPPIIDLAIFGEPTTKEWIGDHIKIGCKGSLNVSIRVEGKSGHVAYFEDSINPITILIQYLNVLKLREFTASDVFGATSLEITSIDVQNKATNVIPSYATAKLNIRFNDQETGDSLIQWVQETAKPYSQVRWTFDFDLAGQPFLSKSSHWVDDLVKASQWVQHKLPTISARGANSDARFLKDYCPVVEIGLRTNQAHQVNECVSIADLEMLTRIYESFLYAYFARAS